MDITVRFVSSIRARAIAVEKQLLRQGIFFYVTEGEGIREWCIDEDAVGGEPDEILAKAEELDAELIAMADVIHEYDPDYFETDPDLNL